MLARLIALLIADVRAELARLDPPLAAPAEPAQRYDLESTTGCQAERAGGWDHDLRPPVRAFGFGSSDTEK